METQGLIAVPKGENEEMDLFVSTQHAALTQVREGKKIIFCPFKNDTLKLIGCFFLFFLSLCTRRWSARRWA